MGPLELEQILEENHGQGAGEAAEFGGRKSTQENKPITQGTRHVSIRKCYFLLLKDLVEEGKTVETKCNGLIKALNDFYSL